MAKYEKFENKVPMDVEPLLKLTKDYLVSIGVSKDLLSTVPRVAITPRSKSKDLWLKGIILIGHSDITSIKSFEQTRKGGGKSTKINFQTPEDEKNGHISHNLTFQNEKPIILSGSDLQAADTTYVDVVYQDLRSKNDRDTTLGQILMISNDTKEKRGLQWGIKYRTDAIMIIIEKSLHNQITEGDKDLARKLKRSTLLPVNFWAEKQSLLNQIEDAGLREGMSGM